VVSFLISFSQKFLMLQKFTASFSPNFKFKICQTLLDLEFILNLKFGEKLKVKFWFLSLGFWVVGILFFRAFIAIPFLIHKQLTLYNFFPTCISKRIMLLTNTPQYQSNFPKKYIENVEFSVSWILIKNFSGANSQILFFLRRTRFSR
jgi:hypothetical protein